MSVTDALGNRWTVDTGYRRLSAALLVGALSFALLPPGLVFDAREGALDASERGAFGLLQWPLLFLAGAALLALRRRLVLAIAPHFGVALALVLLWFLASTLWSVAPTETARRAVRLIALALCAWAYMAASWSPGRFWCQARWVLGLVAAASVVAALAFPEIGLHPPGSEEAGKWQGVTTNKNILGPAAMLGFMLWLHAWATREIRWRQALPWLVVCAAALAGSRSSSAIAVGLPCALLLVLLERPPFGLRRWLLPALATIAALAVVLLLLSIVATGSLRLADLLAPVAGFFGKDLTLTGRADLWRYLLDEIPRHPWLGLGHGAYWLGEWSLSGPAVRELYWVPNQGHNFYLDLVNETGVVGAALFAAFVGGWWLALRRLARTDRAHAVLGSVLLLFLLLHGFTETAMLRAITPLTVLMVFARLDAGRGLFEAELQRRAEASS